MSELVSISQELAKYKEDKDCSQLIEKLRKLRTLCCSPDVQVEICDLGMIDSLVQIVDITSKCDESENSVLVLRIGLQCLVNSVVNNQKTQDFVWSKYWGRIQKWSFIDDKARNYLYALYHNILTENLHEFTQDKDQIKSAVESSIKGTEFAQFLLEKCIEEDFQTVYSSVELSRERVYLIELLDSIITQKDDLKHSKSIQFASHLFKRQSDNLFITKPEAVEKVDLKEVKSLLDVLAHASSMTFYRGLLQKDKSLGINCMYLLIGMHRAGEKLDREQEMQALGQMMSGSLGDDPEFNLKASLIRIVGNLGHKCKEIQDLTRELECLPVILECCAIDAKNPFIREWSILAIKCLTEGNQKNQDYVACVKSFAPTDVRQLPSERVVEFENNL